MKNLFCNLKFLNVTVLSFAASLNFAYANEGSLSIDNKPLTTSITMLDGVSYSTIDDSGINYSFVYRPYLSAKPPQTSIQYLWGLHGKLELSLINKNKKDLISRKNIVDINRKPYYFSTAFSSLSTKAPEVTVEALSVKEKNIMMYRLSNQTKNSLKLKLKIVPRKEKKSYYPILDKKTKSKVNIKLGSAIYSFDYNKKTLEQTFSNPPATDDFDPQSGLVFEPKQKIGQPAVDSSDCSLFAEIIIEPGSDITFAYYFADNSEMAEGLIKDAQSTDFVECKKNTEIYWNKYIANARKRIEKKLGHSLNKLSYEKQKVLENNLIEVRMLLCENGGLAACPAAVHYIERNTAGYWKNWIRDDSIAILNLAELGLVEEYVQPHAELVLNNYKQAKLTNGDYRWWDVFYNYCGNCAGGTEFSQTDSAFYGIWSLYKTWKFLDDDKYITGDAYQLMKDSMNYYRNSLAFDPYTCKKICYFDNKKGLFREFRVGEADITADDPVWYRSPTTGKKYHFFDSLYINSLYHANYKMLAEIADYQGNKKDAELFNQYADELKAAIKKELWSDEKGRFIAGVAYNEDGYEILDFDWCTTGIDYAWTFALPDDKHLPFTATEKEICLKALNKKQNWCNTVFTAAEVAVALPSAREKIVDLIVEDTRKIKIMTNNQYYFPGMISEQFGSGMAPQIFAIAPTLRALCLTVDEESDGEK